MTHITENGILIPYSIDLHTIEENRNIDFKGFIYKCQIIASSGQDELHNNVLLVAVCWNCAIEFSGFYLPVVIRVYMHDHFMQFEDMKIDRIPVSNYTLFWFCNTNIRIDPQKCGFCFTFTPCSKKSA